MKKEMDAQTIPKYLMRKLKRMQIKERIIRILIAIIGYILLSMVLNVISVLDFDSPGRFHYFFVGVVISISISVANEVYRRIGRKVYVDELREAMKNGANEINIKINLNED